MYIIDRRKNASNNNLSNRQKFIRRAKAQIKDAVKNSIQSKHIQDIKDGKIAGKEYRENIGKSSGQCHSCNHGRMIENIKDCASVISHGMGMGIYQDLEANKIKAVVTDEDIAEKAVEKYLQGSLTNRTDRLH